MIPVLLPAMMATCMEMETQQRHLLAQGIMNGILTILMYYVCVSITTVKTAETDHWTSCPKCTWENILVRRVKCNQNLLVKTDLKNIKRLGRPPTPNFYANV